MVFSLLCQIYELYTGIDRAAHTLVAQLRKFFILFIDIRTKAFDVLEYVEDESIIKSKIPGGNVAFPAGYSILSLC